MGRPSKNNCEYFTHQTTMRNHRKIKALRNKFGQVVGYAFWVMMLEYLTEMDGHVMEYTDTEIEMFTAELGIVSTETKEMIEFCIKLELLFVKDGFIHSQSLDEMLAPVYEKRGKAKERSAAQKRRDNGTFQSKSEALGDDNANKALLIGVTVETMPQSKGEEKREEKSRDLKIFSKNEKIGETDSEQTNQIEPEKKK